MFLLFLTHIKLAESKSSLFSQKFAMTSEESTRLQKVLYGLVGYASHAYLDLFTLAESRLPGCGVPKKF